MVQTARSLLFFVSILCSVVSSFGALTVYTVPVAKDTMKFRFDTYAYNPEKTNEGVRFTFTAATDDSVAIIVDTLAAYPSSSKAIDFYGTDASFAPASMVRSSGNTPTTAILPLKPSAGTQYYFIVKPMATLAYDDTCRVFIASQCTLSISVTGAGTTVPNGTTNIWTGTRVPLTATATSIAYFKNWSIPAGPDTIRDTLSKTTLLKVASKKLSVAATFTNKTVFPVTFVLDTFNFKLDAGDPSTGVLFSFTAPSADSFYITPADADVALSPTFRWTYYKTDPTFSAADSIAGTLLPIGLRATAVGEKHFFRIKPVLPADTSANFSMRADSFYVLNVLASDTGVTSPLGTFVMKKNETKPISVVLPTGVRYTLSKWQVTSGSARFADSLALSTNVIMDSSDATVKAMVTKKTVYTIDTDIDTFTYANHGNFQGGGTLLQFTATTSDSFYFELRKPTNHANYIVAYGQDSTFTVPIDTSYSTGVNYITFKSAAPGTKFYFRVYPSSAIYNTYNFITQVYPFKTLTIKHVLGGVESLDTTMTIRAGSPQAIVAPTISGKYYFDKWSRESGTYTIVDSTITSTSITITENTVLKAITPARPPAAISSTWSNYRYTDIAGGKRGGILFTFTAPVADSFEIEVAGKNPLNSHSMKMYYYDTLSACSTVVVQTTVATRKFPVKAAAAGTVYYLRVEPNSVIDTTDTLHIRYFQIFTLTMTRDLAGTTSTYATKEVRSDDSVLIDTATVPGKYYFDQWTVPTGTATVVDPLKKSTKILVQSDVTVKAGYLARPEQPVTFAWDSIGYKDVPGGTRGGLLLSFTAPTADTFLIEIDYVRSYTNRTLYCYGAQERCSTTVTTNTNSYIQTYGFVATAPNQKHYFRVEPYSLIDTIDTIRVRMHRFCPVTLIATNGIVTPDDTIIRDSSFVTISARPNPLSYYFDKWRIIEGTGKLTDSSRASTSLLVDSVAVKVEAFFLPKTVFPITEFDSVYDYGIDGGKAGSGGVIFSFTPPRTDSFAIVITKPTYTWIPSILYSYGTSPAFTTIIDSTKEAPEYYIIVNATAGQMLYFRVAPQNTGYDVNGYGFSIRYEDVHNLTFSATSGGSTRPSGTIVVPDSCFPITDTAKTAGGLYYFDKWKTLSGTVAYFNGTDSLNTIINVAPVHGNAALQAMFLQKTIHTLSTDPQSFYTFSTHGAPKGGVLFKYIASKADSFALRTSIPVSFYYNLDYYDTSSILQTSIDSSRNLLTDGTLKFRTRGAGTYYFRIDTDVSNYTQSFYAYIDTTVLLRVSNNGKGTTIPVDSLRFLRGGIVPLSAIASSVKYRFKVWRRISGNPVFTDSTQQSTSVTISENSQILAVFEDKPVHPISYQPDTLTYAVEGAPNASGGILMKFVAPRTDTFVVSTNVAGPAYNVNIFYYDTASSFDSPRRQVQNTYEASMFGFKAVAGRTYYFRVEPSNGAFYADSISVRVLGFTRVTIQSDGRGITTPSGSAYYLQTVPISISATPASNFFQFWKWILLRGQGTVIGDSLAASTTMTIDTAEVTIQAVFGSFGINTISMAPQKTTLRYDASIAPGLFCTFTSEKADSFLLYVKHFDTTASRAITFYGGDHLFSTAAGVGSIFGKKDTLFRFKASAPMTSQYIKITPTSNNYTDSVQVMWIPFRTLYATSDVGGKITVPAAGSVSKPGGDTVALQTIPRTALFTFKKWTVVSGTVTIKDSLSPITWARTSMLGDATVRATYNAKPHDTLFIEDDLNGITVPLQMALVDTTLDTLIAAYPNSRWIFDHWQIISGKPQVSDTTKMSMRVKLEGNARVKAIFKADSNAKASLVINSVDIGDHPVVEVIATLRDRTGRAVKSTDSTQFTLMQDSLLPPFTATNISGIRGISVSIVIDRSLTMGENGRIDSALAAAETFVDAMGPLDRASVVSFSTGTLVEQGMTGNKNLLRQGIDNVIPSGETAIRDGAYTGVAQLVNETNTRSVIIFSDGYENASLKSLATVIDFARKNNVTIYSIAVGPEAFALVDATLRPLADSTNGYFFFARSTSELAELYQRIKADIESRYLIRYVTPDTVFNGNAHKVILSTQLSESMVTDTGYWDENFIPPEIKLTFNTELINQLVQPSYQAIQIVATISSTDDVVPVRQLSYRVAGAGANNPWVTVDMVFISNKTYSGTIPADMVMRPGIEYKIFAADSRNLTDSKGPYRINIDNSGPLVTHVTPSLLRAYQDIKLKVTASDSDLVTKVLIHYKNATAAFFTTDTLEKAVGDTFTVTIPGSAIFSAFIDYYFEAFDTYDAMTRNPGGSEYRVSIDQPPQIVFLGQTVWSEGDSVFGRFRAVDPENAVVKLTRISSLPTGAFLDSISPSEMVLRWKTGTKSGGDHQFIFTTADSSFSVRDTVIIKVKDIDFPPILTAPANLSGTEGATIECRISAIDPDGNPVQFTTVTLPAGAQFKDRGTDTADFRWSTGAFDAGIHQLIYSVTDGVNVVYDTIRISITDSSFYAPEIFATTTDTIVPTGRTVQISIWATDKDKTIPTLSIAGMPLAAQFIKDTEGDSGVFTWVATAQGEIEIIAIAYDKIGSNQSDTIKIRIKMAQYLATAALLDTNANGYLDKVYMSWNGEARLLDSLPHPGEWLDTLAIKMYDGSMLTLDPVKLVRLDSMHMSIPLNEKTTGLQTGNLGAFVVPGGLPVTTKKLPTVVNLVEDRAGPVIKRAVYYPGSHEANDTRKLIVHFSEPVVWRQIESRPNDFLNFYRDGKRDTMLFSTLSTASLRTVDSAVMILPFTVTLRVNADSLSLLPTAADGRQHLSDSTALRIIPDVNNRRVALSLSSGTIPMRVAVYDTNGQGYIDRITLDIPVEYAFPDQLPPKEGVLSQINFRPATKGALRLLDIVAIVHGDNSHQLDVLVAESPVGSPLETRWDTIAVTLDSTFLSKEGLPFKVTVVNDSVGPVIERALVRTAPLGVENAYDTLQVTFSEQVVYSEDSPLPDQLFSFFTGSPMSRGTPFDRLPSGSITRMDNDRVHIEMTNGFTFNEGNDSIAIRVDSKTGACLIADNGHKKAIINNRRVKISMIVGAQALVCPNPFIPGKSKDPSTGESGVRLILQCTGVSSEYKGTVAIFNALGSEVLPEANMSRDPQNEHWLAFVWDGKDQNNRYVGNGVYMAKFRQIDLKTGKEEKPVYKKIGVARELDK